MFGTQIISLSSQWQWLVGQKSDRFDAVSEVSLKGLVFLWIFFDIWKSALNMQMNCDSIMSWICLNTRVFGNVVIWPDYSFFRKWKYRFGVHRLHRIFCGCHMLQNLGCLALAWTCWWNVPWVTMISDLCILLEPLIDGFHVGHLRKYTHLIFNIVNINPGSLGTKFSKTVLLPGPYNNKHEWCHGMRYWTTPYIWISPYFSHALGTPDAESQGRQYSSRVEETPGSKRNHRNKKASHLPKK